jgi:D-alanine-D-alanine ligase
VADAMADIAVIFGGPSPEHDVSVLTGLQAARALAGGSGEQGEPGGRVRALYWSKAGDWFEVDPGLEGSDFLEGAPAGAAPLKLSLGAGGGFVSEGGRFSKPRRLDVGVALVCCHGGPGEDGTLQGALDLAGIRYAGPSLAGAAIGMDKLAFAAAASAAGLPTLPRVLLREDTADLDFPGPYIVKPRFGGSSIGIDVVEDLATARHRLVSNRHLGAGAVIEPYRADLYDLQIAVRTWPHLALSAVEKPLRTPRAGGVAGEPEILGYADKYAGGEGMAGAPRELPARIDPRLESSLRAAARSIASIASVRGVTRVDFLSDGADLFVNEVNTIPGSLSRYLWIDPPVPFARLIADMLAEARHRPSHLYSSVGADGTVLRGASSIAAKLA